MPWVAAQNPLRRHHRSFDSAVHAKRLDRVFATAWPEPAMCANERTNGPLIGPDRTDADGRSRCHIRPTLSSARIMSACSTLKSRYRVLSRPMSTISAFRTAVCCSASRTASLRRRRVRLRTTALPTFFVTVKPRRSGPWSSRTSAWRTTPPTATFLPFAAARKNSARRVRRFGLRALRDGEGQSIGAGVRAGMEGTPAVRSAFRRTGACGPWRGARPALYGRLQFPCGRGNHAGACGRV
jgi:hypothetical protein